jgi:ribosomal protein S27E
MTEHQCVVCPQLRPGEPRIYERPQVCEGCRSRLRSLLAELLESYVQVKLLKSTGGGAKVSGSRTPPLPLAVDSLDLTLPSHTAAVHDDYGDQVGHPSVASVLDSWARDWQTYRPELLPAPNVSSLVGWLTDRLEWACDSHPAVDDFAAELRTLVGVVRSAAGLTRPKADLKLGVPCRDCERVTLFRWPGSDYVECGSCSVLMTPAEYERWTQLISAPEWRPWVSEIATRGVA